MQLKVKNTEKYLSFARGGCAKSTNKICGDNFIPMLTFFAAIVMGCRKFSSPHLTMHLLHHSTASYTTKEPDKHIKLL